MGSRRVIIGVVGPSNDCPALTHADAVTVGAALATLDAVVLTGGHPMEDPGTVKQGALLLARKQVGIRPRRGKCAWHTEAGGERVVLDLTLPSYARNLLTGQVPDALVALPGGAGTQSEIACALAAGRPVVLLGKQPAPDPHQLQPIEDAIHQAWGAAPALAAVLARGLGTCRVAANPTSAAELAAKLAAPTDRPWHWVLSGRPEESQILQAFGAGLDLLCRR